MFITALFLPDRSTTIQLSLRMKARYRQTSSEVPTKSIIRFFFLSRTQQTENARDDAHHLKKKIDLQVRNRHDREERGIFFFCHALIYIYIFNLRNTTWSLYQNKKVVTLIKRTHVIVKVSRQSDICKILGKIAIKAISQNDIEPPFLNVRQSSKKQRKRKSKNSA